MKTILKKTVSLIASLAMVLSSVVTIATAENASADDIASTLGISAETAAALDLWLEADSGVTSDDAGNVSAWADKTGRYTFEGSAGITKSTTVNGSDAVRFNKSSIKHTFAEEEQYKGEYTMILMSVAGANVKYDNPAFTVAPSWGIVSNDVRIYTLVRMNNGSSNCGLGSISTTIAGNQNMYALRVGERPQEWNNSTSWNIHCYSTNGGAFTTNGMAAGGGDARYETHYNGLHTVTQYEIGDRLGANRDVSAALFFKKGLTNTEIKAVYDYLNAKYNRPKAGNIGVPTAAEISSQLGVSEETAGKLDLWLEADAGVYQNESGQVTDWVDKTGNYAFHETASAGITANTTTNGAPSVRFNNKYLTHTFGEDEYYTGKWTMILFSGFGNKVAGDNPNFTVNGNYWGIGSKNANMGTYVKLDNGTSNAAVGGFQLTAGAPLSMYALKNGYDASQPDTYNWNLHNFATNGGGFTSNFMAAGSVRGEGNYRGLHSIQQYRIGENKGTNMDVSAALLFKTTLSNADVASIYDYLYSKYITPQASAAKISEDGKIINVTLNGERAVLGKKLPAEADFSVNVNGEEAKVLGIVAASGANVVSLNIDAQVKFDDAVTVSYVGSTALEGFYDMAVDMSQMPDLREIAPKVVDSYALMDGKNITLVTDTEVKGYPMAADFKVNNVNPVEVTVDGKTIKLRFEDAFSYKSALSVNYTGTEIKNLYDKAMDAFSDLAVAYWCGPDAGIPTDGLDLWLEADSGVTKNDSNQVTAWADKTGNYTFTATASDKIKVADTANGSPSVAFNGANLTYDCEDYKGDNTVILMVDVNSAVNQDRKLLTVNGYHGITAKANNVWVYARNKANPNNIETIGKVVFDTTEDKFKMFSVSYETDVENIIPDIYGNNEPQVSGSRYYDNNINIKSYTVGDSAGQSEIVAALVYKRALSQEEIDSVYQYLYEKYQLADGVENYYTFGEFEAEQKGAEVTISGEYSRNKFEGTLSSACIGAAVYDKDGRLAGLSMAPVSLKAGLDNTFNKTVTLAEGVEAKTVKAFMWKNFGDITPVKAAQDAEVTYVTAE